MHSHFRNKNTNIFISTIFRERQNRTYDPEMQNSYAEAQSVVVEREKSYIQCDPCNFNDEKVEASFFCKECDENFCQECMEYHRAQKENKNHQVRDLYTKALMCYNCKDLNKEAMANSYCEDCNVPTPLCEPCAKKHIKMKSTRGHRLSDNLSSLATRLNKTLQTEQCVSVQHRQYATDKTKTIFHEKSSRACGKPYSIESKSDRIHLQWQSDYKLNENENYQIMYKENPNGKWKIFSGKTSCKSTSVVVDGLKSNTTYIFKVRIINDSTGDEDPFTEESNNVKTRQSPALEILEKSGKPTENGTPKVYRLPIKENILGRNEKAKTRKFVLGKASTKTTERTIMIVGATGSGKSTLINGMANYLMGVTWEDPFRFTLIDLEPCERKREKDPSKSLTEWVTCYTLHTNVSDRVNYSVNLIDTPGFGDTRGLAQDEKIIEQIRELFTTAGEKGVATLDAVCFILIASGARLTPTQRYIFESILSLFGNDIKDNICTLVTFADGQKPKVLSAIQSLDGLPLPIETYFPFNNSALFVDNTTSISNNLSPFFWDMGNQSCEKFFDHLSGMKTKSLKLTSEVLKNRKKLENTVRNLQQEIEAGLCKINVLEKEVKLFTENADAILANKHFEYEVDEEHQEKTDLRGTGRFTTNCLTCNFTCHDNCSYANDADKASCVAMDSKGNCTQCKKRCHWSEHHNTPYIFKLVTHKVKKNYDEMKKKYEEATQKTLTQEQLLAEMTDDITKLEESIQVMLEVIAQLNNRLKEIALRPDPLSTVEYIELMIDSEKRGKKSGFEARIDALEKCKQRSTYGQSVQIFKDRISKTRMAASDVAQEILKDDSIVIGKIKGLFGFKK